MLTPFIKKTQNYQQCLIFFSLIIKKWIKTLLKIFEWEASTIFFHNQQNWNLTPVFDHISIKQNPIFLVVNEYWAFCCECIIFNNQVFASLQHLVMDILNHFIVNWATSRFFKVLFILNFFLNSPFQSPWGKNIVKGIVKGVSYK